MMFIKEFLVDSVVLMSLKEEKKLRMCPSPSRQLTFSHWLWTRTVMFASQVTHLCKWENKRV